MNEKPTILVVDDERGIRDLLAYEFRFQGWEVISAVDGAEGSEPERVAKADVVLLDMTMPRMNGFAALAEIRRQRPELPVILMTGNLTVDAPEECRSRGAFDVAMKPFHLDEISAKVQAALKVSRP